MRAHQPMEPVFVHSRLDRRHRGVLVPQRLGDGGGDVPKPYSTRPMTTTGSLASLNNTSARLIYDIGHPIHGDTFIASTVAAVLTGGAARRLFLLLQPSRGWLRAVMFRQKSASVGDV